MASTDFQWASFPIPGADIPFYNSGLTGISAGTALKPDTSNPVGPTLGAPGMIIAGLTNAALGFAVEAVPSKQEGRMRVYGVVIGIAGATGITPGSALACGATGTVVTNVAGAAQVGYALSAGDTVGGNLLVLIDRANNA